MPTIRTAILLVLLIAIAALAGCGGSSPDLIAPNTGAVVADVAPQTLANLTAGMDNLQTGDLLAKEAPADANNDEINAGIKGGGGPTTIYSEPQRWYGGKWHSLKPSSGKTGFVGPQGIYRFVESATLNQSEPKGGIGNFKVVNDLPMPFAQQSEGRWNMTPDFYTITGVGARMTLQILSASAGQPLMRTMAVDPALNQEYHREAYGRYSLDDRDLVMLLAAWYNPNTGLRTTAPKIKLAASVYGDNLMLQPTGGQEFVVMGLGVCRATLSLYPKWGGDGWWSSYVKLSTYGRGAPSK
jgi:hypothetical protein